jgi:isopentenyl-diphosphate delta-isomerase
MNNLHDERIVFVDKNGVPTGETGPKLDSHNADTKLHLAFSCYVFNDRGEFLVTQRAHGKKVWPGVWTNSVCGHPAPGESIKEAIKRRLKFELGMTAKDFQVIVPKYTYKTSPYKGIIEHEFCPVFVARATSAPIPNPDEVEAYKWVKWEAYVAAAEADTKDVYSWWCKDQLKLIKKQALIGTYASIVDVK